MKSFIISIGILLLSVLSHAQPNNSSYTTAVGVKIYPGSISAKHFYETNRAVEGLLYVFNYGMRITGLYEIYGDLSTIEGLKWYIGPGAHIGFWNNSWRVDNPTRQSGVNLGVDGVIGVDYKIKGAPINISLDWQPSFNIIGYSYFEGAWGGLGIRYTIN